MTLSKTTFATACGLITAGTILTCGIAHLIWPPYAGAFLDLVASIYPGFEGGSTFWQVIVGTIYGLFDGFVGGWIFAWLYNRLLRSDHVVRHSN